MSKLLIVIPAYNEEANIVKVVNGIVKNYPQYDYVVVNDGSRDKTAAICRELWGWQVHSRPGCAMPPKTGMTAPCSWMLTASTDRNISPPCWKSWKAGPTS